MITLLTPIPVFLNNIPDGMHMKNKRDFVETCKIINICPKMAPIMYLPQYNVFCKGDCINLSITCAWRIYKIEAFSLKNLGKK